MNFDKSFAEDLSLTSQAELAERRLVLDFAQNEVNFIQPAFLMDGKTVVTYDPDATPNAVGDIEVKRFASKLTVALNLVDEVVLKHTDKGESTEPDEVWTPVPHTARIYLVDGIKSVLVSEDGLDPNPDYFSYRKVSRAFVKENGSPQLDIETIGEKTYYTTWPMYSYPASWSSALPDHSQIDYQQGLPPEPPYFKLEMDWRREPQNGYSYAITRSSCRSMSSNGTIGMVSMLTFPSWVPRQMKARPSWNPPAICWTGRTRRWPLTNTRPSARPGTSPWTSLSGRLTMWEP